MAQRGRRVYVLADSSKLGRSPFDAWAQVGSYTLVTDSNATDEQLAPFIEAGVQIEIAPLA